VSLRLDPRRSDWHVHLYGCPTAEDLWTLGRDRYQSQAGRLEWYAAEYEKAEGRHPEWQKYWQSDNGLELLRQDYIVDRSMTFAPFQARFNLIIALAALSPDDTTVLTRVLNQHHLHGVQYIEYRFLMPATFTDEALDRYLKQYLQAILASEQNSGGTFMPRAVLTMPRDNQMLMPLYGKLRRWMTANPKLSKMIAGLDFCMFEELHPPSAKIEFMAQLQRDNTANPAQILPVYYHVGETFETIQLASSVRWVAQAADLGVARLGHAVSLGIDPELLRDHTVHELVSQRHEHLQWLLAEKDSLARDGYQVDLPLITKELSTLQHSKPADRLPFTYDTAGIDDCRHFQGAIMQRIKRKDAVIESCISSNLRLGKNLTLPTHPLRRFADAGLNICLGTDDPGIFCTDLKQEWQLAETLLTATQVNNLNRSTGATGFHR